jgi:inhibitor of KinA
VDRREEVTIKVCYNEQFGSDLPFISETTHLNVEEIIDIHLSKQYRLYMIGFLPGFAYMGELDERIQVPRKQKPEAVVAGSVGIASGQTGIYPLDAPGGWHIIGRTPMKLFDPHDSNPVKLKAGQLVSFQRISLSEFEQLSPPK